MAVDERKPPELELMLREGQILSGPLFFDSYFALSVSRVDPLPHQLEAVYDYFVAFRIAHSMKRVD